MNLVHKQDEWSDLLAIESIERPLPPADMFDKLTMDDRLDLAAAWLVDGIHARHTDYPRTATEIKYFTYSRSAWLRGLFNFCVVVQLVSTFLDNDNCNREEQSVGTRLFNENGSPTRLVLTIFALMCLCVYLLDLYFVFAVNPTKKSPLAKPWSTFRLLICLFVFLDCVIYFINPAQPRLMRCMFPFLLISRRNNLKLMCQGLFISAYNSLPIIKALVTILVMWGFAGFFFFRATDSTNQAFENPGESMAEALHCFTSRPYVLKSLDSIYPSNQASALYFISLTLAADILCIALIVAVGAKHYKQFAVNILQARLVDRRHAVSCAFFALCNTTTAPEAQEMRENESMRVQQVEMMSQRHLQASVDSEASSTASDAFLEPPVAEDTSLEGDRTISRDTWLELCAHTTGKYATSPHTADFVFDFVIDADPREHADEVGTTVRKFVHTIDEFLFFRCCALLATRIVIEVEAVVPDEFDDEEITAVLARRSSAAIAMEARRRSMPSRLFAPAPLTPINEHSTRDSNDSAGDYQATDTASPRGDTNTNTNTSAKTSTRASASGKSSRSGVTVVNVDAELEPGADPTSHQVLRYSERMSRASENNLTRQRRQSELYAKHLSARSVATTVLDATFSWVAPLRALCVQITGAQMTIATAVAGEGPNHKPKTFSLFYWTRIFLLVLMACFWLHLSIRIVAVGVRRFVSFYENRGDTLLNLCSLIAFIFLSQEYQASTFDFQNSTALGWYLLIQCGRLFKLFFVFNDVRIFEHMRPVLIRASFVYFSIIYFFSIFGYSYFCDSMNETDAGNTSPSNDAGQWVAYSNILNFDTLLQSMFTLFEMSILGNWSIVMDAAVASTNKPAGAYIFFYTYRLCITLFVLPILMSFLIQVFLSALTLRDKEKAQEEQATKNVADQDKDGRMQRSNSVFSRRSEVQAGGRQSTTQVSYNVNQEVLVLGRPSNHLFSTDSGLDFDPNMGLSSQRDDHFSDTAPSSRTTSAASGASRASGATESTQSTQSSTARPRRWSALSINFGVNKAVATTARDKHSESVTRGSMHSPSRPTLTTRESEMAPLRHSMVHHGGVGGVGAGSSTSTSTSAGMAVPSSINTNNPSPLRSRAGNVSPSSSPRQLPTTAQLTNTLALAQSPPRASHIASKHTKVTVQYDSKGTSSMMSIWTIDGGPGPAQSRSAKNSKRKNSVASVVATSGGGSRPELEVALLKEQLQDALDALEEEKKKNMAIDAQGESFL